MKNFKKVVAFVLLFSFLSFNSSLVALAMDELQTPEVQEVVTPVEPVVEEVPVVDQTQIDLKSNKKDREHEEEDHKINICHKDGNSGHWNAISVDQNGWSGHSVHTGDYLYAGPLHDGEPSRDGDKWCEDNAPKPVPTTATINATKIVCDSEADLPNWGAGGQTIDSNTASSFLDGKEGKCHVQSGWGFEFGVNAPDGGPATIGHVDGYTAFSGGATNVNGTTSTTVPAGEEIHVREVLQAGYIPFTGQNTTESVSAEFYCSGDTLNYDNWDFIRNPVAGNTYDCVAFNAPVVNDEPQQCDPKVNLIQNGDFETPTIPSSNWDIVPDSNPVLKWLVAWVAAPLSFEPRLGLEIQNNAAGASFSGNQHAELDGDSPVTIWQDVPTIPGKQYDLTFKYSPRPIGEYIYGSTDPLDNALQVKINNADNGALISGTTIGTTAWTTVTRSFVATSTTTKVEIMDKGTDNGTGGYVDNVSLNCNPNPAPQTSTIKMCKFDDTEKPLSNWQLMLSGESVGSVNVNPDGNDYKILGVPVGDYILKATGMYTYRPAVSGAEYSDSAYSKRDPSDAMYQAAALDPNQAPYLPWVRENNFLNPIQGWLGVMYENAITDWGSVFNPSHVYALGTTKAVAGDMSFKILDSYYEDNSGFLTVDANRGYTGVTGADGCVTFSNVPYGTYTADEILKEGWTKVSGTGEVVVNEPTETIIIVNHEVVIDPEPTMGTIEITKYVCPANFVPNRTTNGVGSIAPEGCTLKSGVEFGYVHGNQTDANGPYPELSVTPTSGGVTGVDGKLVIGPVLSAGRYLIKETNSTNLQGLYCQGDGDTNPNNNDNQELTFVPANGVTKCVAYNKTDVLGETATNNTTVVRATDLETTTDIPTAVTNNSGKWFFYNDTNDTINNSLGGFVTGPAVAPIGSGSAEMIDTASDSRINIATYKYQNTKLSDIKGLAFSAYSHSGVAGPSESPYLVFNVSFDGSNTWQKRLVYVPANNGAVPQDGWNTFDTINGGAGNWVYSGTTWPTTVDAGTTTKTWSQIMALYPNARVLPVGGLMGVRVGEPGPQNYVGNVDKFVIGIKTGINTHTETYDFEPAVIEACNAGAYTDLSDNSGAIRFEEGQGYNTGSINGVNGWTATGSYDFGVVANTFGYSSFNDQAFRISDGITSGSFGDWAFATPNINGAGEAESTSGIFSKGILQNHFEAQFDVASTVPCALQEGLHFSVSPDRGDGSRMSYLRFEDTATGLDVYFDDVTGINNESISFNETLIANDLNRSIPHKFKFVMDFVNGPSNDIVKIYVDGSLAHTGTSWENYYRYDSESSAEQSPRIVKTLIFQARGTAHPANTGKGYLVDNLTLGSSVPAPFCSDGVDNDEDNLIDANDPGCMSGDGGTYDPNDNDETNVVVDTTPIKKTGSSGGSLRGTPQGQVLGASTACGIYVDKFLRRGYKNDVDAVMKLQKFLNDYMNAGIKEDGKFGLTTEIYLKKFQTKHADKILAPWGFKSPTGIFYLTTQTEVNNIMCPELKLSIPNLTPIETNPLAPKKED